MAGVPVMAGGVVAPPVPGPVPVSPGDSAAVRFGEAKRAGTATHVAIAEFDGPLGLLLTLIEARRFDVLTVPLGALAEAYLDALAGLKADRLGNVSGFVAVASQLILIKSRAMLPRPPAVDAVVDDDTPDPEAELRARLILYRAHRDAGLRLADVARQRIGLFRREPTVARAAAIAGANPMGSPPLDPARLVSALDRLVVLAPPMELPPEVLARVITLTERAEIIRAALRDAPSVVLQELLAGVRDRVVVAITFLAMLELMKRREIVVSQDSPWGPIVARATTPDERRAAGVGIEPETELDETLESFA